MWPNHRYLAMNLVAPLFFIMIGWMFIQRYHSMLINQMWFQIFAYIGSVLMGVWAAFILFSIPVDVAHLIAWIVRKIGTSAHDEDRREFITNSLRMGVLGAAGSIGVLGLIDVWRGPSVKHVPIQSDKLPSALKNLKIAHISDLHVGVTIRKGYVNEVVEKANEISADLVFITGDLADGKTTDLEEHLRPLSNLKGKYGVYYVVGNHEYYWGVNEYLNLMKSFGFKTLINENTIIEVAGSKLMIAGITDPQGVMVPGHAPNLEKTIANDQKADFKILLAHRPDVIIEAEPLGFDLQFSGHTHAGQFFPFNVLVPLVHKYYKGLNRHGSMQVYVNPGTAYWGPPNRFAIPSEITSITLV